MSINIAWVDDEIESLKAQILFLNNKGYTVHSFTNGYDLLTYLQDETPEAILLDESMPGMTGLEVLMKIKEVKKHIPVIMVTKNEEEYIMEEALGAQITDYLIKPVNPNQVLLSIKKSLDRNRLVDEKTTSDYQKEFAKLFTQINDNQTAADWKELYKKLVFWELEISKGNSEMADVILSQKAEANNEFFKFISKNYLSWINKPNEYTPILSDKLFATKIAPVINKEKPTFMILIDNLRYDQWVVIEPFFNKYFKAKEEDLFYSILPSTTQYSRNSIFSGLMPAAIEKNYPKEWIHDDEEGGKNNYEDKFLGDQLKRLNLGDIKWEYIKVTNNEIGKSFEDNALNYLKNDLTVVVYNFVDMLSHARTEMEVLKELAGDELSYRSITSSWFEHSPLFGGLKKLADKNIQLIITTDHGTTRVKTPAKVVGDKATTSNLRYKHGRNLQYKEKEVFSIVNPNEAGLPQPNVNSKYIFAREDIFLCYPNNFNYYANYYKNTFQHGGISLEEIIVPIIRMESK